MKNTIPVLVTAAGLGQVALDVLASSFEAVQAALRREGFVQGCAPDTGKKACIYQRYIIALGERMDMQQIQVSEAPTVNGESEPALVLQ